MFFFLFFLQPVLFHSMDQPVTRFLSQILWLMQQHGPTPPPCDAHGLLKWAERLRQSLPSGAAPCLDRLCDILLSMIPGEVSTQPPAWLQTPNQLQLVTRSLAVCINLPAWLRNQEEEWSCGSVVHGISFALPLLLLHANSSPVHWHDTDSQQVAATLFISDYPIFGVPPLAPEAWKRLDRATRPTPDTTLCHLPLCLFLKYLDTFMEATHHAHESRTEPPQLPALFYWRWIRVVVCTQNPVQLQKVILLRAQHYWVISDRTIDDQEIQPVLTFIRCAFSTTGKPHNRQHVINTRFFPAYVPKVAQLLPYPAVRVQES